MPYIPMNYNTINVYSGLHNPSQVKSINNRSFSFWERSLFQRACSVLDFELPEEWDGSTRDFFYYCLFKFGYVAVFKREDLGIVFQPCTLKGQDFYYQPTNALINNPIYEADLKIGEECAIIKLTPDFMGIWDIINYYAEKLSHLDNAINMSLINSKLAHIIGARNKTGGEALKKILDKVNKGEPSVIYDMKLLNDPTDKAEPFQYLDLKVKDSYITTDLLKDFQTILNNFDAEIGIPTIPYEKKERFVKSEAESRIIDSMSRSIVWYDTLSTSLVEVNRMFGTNISVELRYYDEATLDGNEEEVNEDEQL